VLEPGSNIVGPQAHTSATTASSSTGHPEPPGRDEAIDERRSLLLRISSSPQFRRSPKIRDFLTYVVEQTIQGRSDALNEYQIGRAVFGRADDYSPSEDNVVRAHARQLRVKLSEYFAASGKDEPLIVEIPKGTYVPAFSPRVNAPAVPSTEEPASRSPLLFPPRILLWGMLALLVVSLGTSAFLAFQNRALRRQVAGFLPSTTIPPPLAWVLDPDRSVSLVVADSCFGLMQDLAGRPASLEEYLDSEFWQGAKPSTSASSGVDWLMHRVRSRQLTSYADVLLATRILRLAGPRATMPIRFARDVRPRDLNSGNYIFLGSSYSNPWVALYDRKRNFRIQVDAASRQSIVNKRPRPGEQASYQVFGEDGAPGATYGLIAFRPSDGTTGNVLIIEGTNMEGTEAAGSMILDPKSARNILSQAGIAADSRTHPFFEVLIETKVLAGEPSQTRVIAWRR
jgi:hypothetical protein